MKKKLLSLSFLGVLVLGGCCLLFTVFFSEKYQIVQKTNLSQDKEEPVFLSEEQILDSERKVAPLSSKSKEKKEASNKDKTIEEAPKRAIASLPPMNPSNKKAPWRRRLNRSLSRKVKLLGAKVSVKALGAAKIKMGASTEKVERVLVSMDRGKGNVSSYEAYVNPKTGRILKTWNHTRFENKEPLAIQGRAFRP